MARLVIPFYLFFLPFSFCCAQSADSILQAQHNKRLLLIEWFHDRSSDHPLIDSATEHSLRDSGHYENGLKEGLWKEYFIDSSSMGTSMNVQFGKMKSVMFLDAKFHMAVGYFVNGLKEGMWTEYTTDNVQAPFYWRRNSEIHYKGDRKDGLEILYQGYLDQTPLIIRSWSGGKEIGPGEVYNANFPYKLRQRYIAGFTGSSVTETYYASGQLESRFSDTIVEGKPLTCLQQYFENGVLARTGYYSDGSVQVGAWVDYYNNGRVQATMNFSEGKLDGSYLYFHDNGELWTERVYINGKLTEVRSNFNRQGEPLFPGTITGGNGTMVLYDQQGNLIKTILYENGEEKYSTR